MASGVPVVATSVGGVPELVVVDVTGALAPPGDEAALARALVELVRDPARRARLGQGGRARACAHFPLGRQVEETAALLHSLAAERTGFTRPHSAVRAPRVVHAIG